MLPLMLFSIVDEGLLPFSCEYKSGCFIDNVKIGRKVINKN